MIPSLHEQVQDLTPDHKKCAPNTEIGLHDPYQLLTVIATYKDWIVTRPDPAHLSNLLGSMTQSAHDVNRHLNLSDRAVSTFEATIAGERDLFVLTQQVAEFLKTPPVRSSVPESN